MEKLRKWGPEYFAFKIYKLFTYIRVPIFWLLFLFFIIDIFWLKMDFTIWFPFWSPALFTSLSINMIYLLLSIGAFTAAFITIGVEIIKTKPEAQSVTHIWSNLVKYAIYPFVIAMLIGFILFLRKVGVNLPAHFSIFILFVYLTINSFYTTIRAGENLVNEAWYSEQKAK